MFRQDWFEINKNAVLKCLELLDDSVTVSQQILKDLRTLHL